MLRKRYIKFSIFSFLTLVALLIASSKVYTYHKVGHNQVLTQIDSKSGIRSQSAEDFEKYKKPVYFSIFKFICALIPTRPQQSGRITEQLLTPGNISYAVSLLYGPALQ